MHNELHGRWKQFEQNKRKAVLRICQFWQSQFMTIRWNLKMVCQCDLFMRILILISIIQIILTHFYCLNDHLYFLPRARYNYYESTQQLKSLLCQLHILAQVWIFSYITKIITILQKTPQKKIIIVSSWFEI